jgi:hypothetical protein
MGFSLNNFYHGNKTKWPKILKKTEKKINKEELLISIIYCDAKSTGSATNIVVLTKF